MFGDPFFACCTIINSFERTQLTQAYLVQNKSKKLKGTINVTEENRGLVESEKLI